MGLVVGICLLACGCKKEEPQTLDINQQKPDLAEQISKGEQPSGADYAKDLSKGK